LLAAHHFAWLVLGMPMDRGLFLPATELSDGTDLDALADAGVRVFLAAYTRR
jgi:TetR/AcrR family transcriptional regulator, mexJK operon transcriptional repressor